MEATLGIWRISVTRVTATVLELSTSYDRAARSWNRGLARIGYPGGYRRLLAALRQQGLLQSLRQGGRMLDCGIGAAALSLALIATSGCNLEVTGVDVAPMMLLEAGKELSKAGVKADLHRNDATALPFDDRLSTLRTAQENGTG